ncbi:MAG: cytochrome c3 family protein [Thermodesulfobacteriota bacterium]|nr:cytochrome c3 family protein [Thermodesulfobacteriota bacterium]
MKKHRRRWITGAVLISVLALGIAVNGYSDDTADTAGGSPDASVITLDLMAAIGDLERPSVRFPHGNHVVALGEADSCVVCHDLADVSPSFDYVQEAGRGARSVRNQWHQKCLDCHQAMIARKEASGPLTCGECHIRNVPPPAPQQPTAFYDTAHELHEYLDEGCGECHHVYDPQAGELYYAEGEEEACWQCHTENGDDRTPSLEDAAHQTCIPCHLDAGDPAAMPVDCAGCHGTGE